MVLILLNNTITYTCKGFSICKVLEGTILNYQCVNGRKCVHFDSDVLEKLTHLKEVLLMGLQES